MPGTDHEAVVLTHETAEQETQKLNILSAVICSTEARREKTFFIGWNGRGNPVVVEDQNLLTDEAQQSYDAHRMAGLRTKTADFTQINPLEYILTGEAVDFKDTKERKAEDLVTFQVNDGNGRSKTIYLPERLLFQAIVDANEPFQDTGGSRLLMSITSARSMYTLLVPAPEMGRGAALAILFKPTIEGQANEPDFKAFIRQAVGKLLVLDESQPREGQKGYLEAAAKVAGTNFKGGPLDTLFALRKLGLVDFKDEAIESLRKRGRELLSKGLKIGRLFGLIDVSNERLERITSPMPDYDVDKLDIAQLFELAEAMLEVAYDSLGRTPR